MSSEFIEGTPYDEPETLSSQNLQLDTEAQAQRQKVWDELNRRRSAWQRFIADNMQPGDSKVILEDMRRFCRGGVSTYATDQRDHALLTGRNEVWLRVQMYIELSMDDLFNEMTQPKEPI